LPIPHGVRGRQLTLAWILWGTAFLAPLLFVLSFSLLQREVREGRAIRDELHRSYEARIALTDLLRRHLDLETAQRGYVLTGDPEFLAPYREEESLIQGVFATLENSVVPGSVLDANLQALHTASTMKRQFVAEGIALAQAGKPDEARELIAAGRGKQLMDRIRVLIDRMEAQENAAMAGRLAAGEQASRRVRTSVLVGSAVLSLLLLLAALAGLRMNRARQKAVGQLQASLATQNAMFDNAPDGLLLFDQAGRIEALNPCVGTMFGYPPERLLALNVATLLVDSPSGEEVRDFLSSLQSGRTGPTAAHELQCRRADGDHFPAEVSIAAFPADQDGDRRYLAVVRDITLRKQVEKMKNEFISVVSHELRTPLTSIVGSLGLLAGGAAGEMPERAMRLVRIAHSNSERLVRLVNDILDLEKIGAGMLQLDLAPTPLPSVIEQTIQQNAGFANEHGVRLEAASVPSRAEVMADEDRLVQILTNLISNAVKFSPAGEVVRVRAMPLDGMMRISVEDRGPGIPEEFHAMIYERFTQADASDTRQKGGTGLGLTIVSELVALHRGRLSFETGRGGGGTTFHVDLPAAGVRAGRRRSDASPQSAGR